MTTDKLTQAVQAAGHQLERERANVKIIKTSKPGRGGARRRSLRGIDPEYDNFLNNRFKPLGRRKVESARQRYEVEHTIGGTIRAPSTADSLWVGKSKSKASKQFLRAAASFQKKNPQWKIGSAGNVRLISYRLVRNDRTGEDSRSGLAMLASMLSA